MNEDGVRDPDSKGPDSIGLDRQALDTHALCLLVSERHHALVDLECEMLELAALWADHYSTLPDSDADDPFVVAGAEKRKLLGGEGTPLIWEFAPAEFGVLQQMSMYQASTTIADALDLRHRLPLIWARVRAGEVRAWQACKVAQATRGLSREAAGFVDRAMVGSLSELSWGRCARRLAAKVIEADPEAARRHAEALAADRFVRTGRSEEGFKSIFARATAGDVLWLDATLDRIAAVLAFQGDTGSRDVRRSKALGIVAQPARALLMLTEFQDASCDFDRDEVPDGEVPDADGQDPLVDAEPPVDPEPPEDPEPPVDPEPPEGPEPPVDAERPTECDPSGDPWQLTDADLVPEQREMTPTEAATARNTALVREHLKTLKPADLLPPVTLYLHLHADTLGGMGGAVRFEDVGPVTLGQMKDLLGTGCQVKVQPVIDLNDAPSSDAYEAPERIRDALRLRIPGEVFPWGTSVSRHLDFDHVVPYRPPERGGPPGQTRIGNAAFLSRKPHRIRTHGRWKLRQPEPGSYLWRSPHGWFHLVNASGSHDLGRDEFAQRIWDAAKDAPTTDVVRPFSRVELRFARHLG